MPVYNHADKIGSVLEKLIAYGAKILVVDDGSTDQSGAVAENYQENLEKSSAVEVVYHTSNQGKAAALQTGLRHAAAQGYALALTCDADGQHLAEDCLSLARQAAARQQTCQQERQPQRPILHVGHRKMPHAPLKSRLGRWWSNGAATLLAGSRLSDTQSGLRVYPLPICTQLPTKSQGFSWEIEILVLSAWAKIPIHHHSIGVHYGSDRVSHFSCHGAIRFEPAGALLRCSNVVYSGTHERNAATSTSATCPRANVM